MPHARLTHALAKTWIIQKIFYALRELLREMAGNEEARLAMNNQLRQRANSGSDNRRSTGHGLERGESKTLVERRHRANICGGVEIGELGLWDGGLPANVLGDARGLCLLAEPIHAVLILRAAHQHEPHSCGIAHLSQGPHEHVRPLEGFRSAHEQDHLLIGVDASAPPCLGLVLRSE